MKNRLTPREREALELAAQGLNTAAIAAQMAVCDTSVDAYFWRIYRKLGIRTPREQAVHLYRRGEVR